MVLEIACYPTMVTLAMLLTYCTPQVILLELKRYNAKNVEMMMYNAIHTQLSN